MKIKKKGVSLIVLVITIIVMIILAGAIILSLSNSGIIDKANKAKEDSDIAAMKEIIGVIEAEYAFNDEKVTLEKVASKLEESGIKTKKVTDATPQVTSITLDKSSVEMQLNQIAEITVTVKQDNSSKERLYANVGDKYYEIYEGEEGNIEISQGSSIPENQELKIEVEGANYVTTSINQDTKKITLTSKSNAGTDMLTIKYGGKTVTCNVEVKNSTMIKFYVDEWNGTTSEYIAEEGMTWGEFIESSYNVDGWDEFKFPGPSYGVGVYLVHDSYIPCSINDTIINEKHYEWGDGLPDIPVVPPD